MQRFVSLLMSLLFLSIPLDAETLEGVLKDPQGNPVAGIRLLLNSGSGKTMATATTDNQGAYHFTALQPGLYEVFIRESGFQQQRMLVQIESGHNLEKNLVLQLEPLQQNVVVTATRTESAASFLGASVTTLTPEEISARQSTNVADLLRSVPSINVHQVGGRGGVTSLFVRGGNSDYNKILLDGMPINEPGGASDLSLLSSVNVERIEIVRGPQSALYGSDAISSVIQVISKKGPQEQSRPEAGLMIEGGSFDSFRGGGDLAGHTGPFSYSAQFQQFTTDNAVPNDFFHSSNLGGHASWDFSHNSSLDVSARVERGRSGVPGPTAFGPADLDESYRKRDFFAGVHWNQRVSDRWSQQASYSQSYVNQLSEDPVASPVFVPSYEGHQAAFPNFDYVYSFLSATRRHNLNYQSDWVLSTHLISAGVDFEEQRGTVGDIRASRANSGFYMQDQFFWRQRLSVTGGLRLEDNGSFGFAAVPRLSAAILARRGSASGFLGMTRPKFNFGLGIKEPNFIQSYSQNPYFRGNPDLKPEKTRSFEAGIEQEFFGEKVRAEVNYFRSLFDDLISFQTTNYSTYEGSYFNLGRSRAWGIEHIGEVRLARRLKVSAGYTYLKSEVLKSSNAFDLVYREGARLLLRPTHSGQVTLTWLARRWQMNTTAIFVGNRADSDFVGIGLTQVQGYTRWDLSGSYQLNNRLSLFAVLENLLNEQFFEAIGYPALKLNFRSGLRIRL